MSIRLIKRLLKKLIVSKQMTIEEMATTMWKGVKLKDMSKDELIVAFYQMGQYYEHRLKEKDDDCKDIMVEFGLIR